MLQHGAGGGFGDPALPAPAERRTPKLPTREGEKAASRWNPLLPRHSTAGATAGAARTPYPTSHACVFSSCCHSLPEPGLQSLPEPWTL